MLVVLNFLNFNILIHKTEININIKTPTMLNIIPLAVSFQVQTLLAQLHPLLAARLHMFTSVIKLQTFYLESDDKQTYLSSISNQEHVLSLLHEVSVMKLTQSA